MHSARILASNARRPGSSFPKSAADGTDERGSTLLARSPLWSPADGALLVVAPHPNDEILGAGGLIRTWATRGRPVNVLSLSDGEAATSQIEGLATVRREELREALRKLCPTHVSVTRLGLPDGKIGEHLNRVRNALMSFCRDRLTLIAPYERDGHPDHAAVGALCVDFARSQNIPVARYTIRGWSHRDPRRLAGERWVKFDLSDDAKRAKARAIQCFRSQIEPPAPTIPPPAFGNLEHEVFVLRETVL